MQFKVKNVTLEHIDSGDETYRITTKEGADDLVESLAHVGLVNPPILIKNNSRYTIVCGFRRISAYRCLKLNHISARILPQNTKQLECATYAIVDNAYQRPLNLVEVSRSINMLDRFMDKTKQAKVKLKAMGLPENQSLVNKIKTIDHLPLALKNGILSNTLSLSMALDLGKLDKKTGIAFAQIFENLKLSLSKQREIFTLVKEIAHRNDLPLLAVLKKPELRAILDDGHFDRNQKAQKIRKHLKQVRFPTIAKAENTFETHIKTLNLNPNAMLIPPKNFESTRYTLTFTFSSLEELHDHKFTFETMLESPTMQTLLG